MQVRASRIAALAAVTVVIAAVIWGYVSHERREVRKTVVALVRDAAQRLRTDITADPTTDATRVSALAADVQSTAADVDRLHSLKTDSMSDLADAADDYLVTVREILRRRADFANADTKMAESARRLADHIAAGRGRPGWPDEAVRLHTALKEDMRAAQIAVESYASLLDTLPASQAKIAAQIDSAPLIDAAALDRARRNALAVYARAGAEARKTADLYTYQDQRRGAVEHK